MSNEELKKEGSISVEAENIFPVIKKWLYSDKEIFLREIVSNACDAVTKMKRLASLGEREEQEGEHFRVDVVLDKENKTLSVMDNGVGMTEEQCCNILRKDAPGSSGIGLKNVNDRLKIYFGEPYGITIHSVPDEGTTVFVRFPKKEDNQREL